MWKIEQIVARRGRGREAVHVPLPGGIARLANGHTDAGVVHVIVREDPKDKALVRGVVVGEGIRHVGVRREAASKQTTQAGRAAQKRVTALVPNSEGGVDRREEVGGARRDSSVRRLTVAETLGGVDAVKA